MSDLRWIIALVIVAVIVAIVAVVVMRNRRSAALRSQFGPEYRTAVREFGSVKRAETALDARRERVRRLPLRPLGADEADRFASSWRAAQARFVDDPRHAIDDADRLVQTVMKTRGYPVGDFEQRVDDVSVDHPAVVEHYRAAHRIAVANADGTASTEDLRQAMIHYRALFDDLLEIEDEPPRRMEAGR